MQHNGLRDIRNFEMPGNAKAYPDLLGWRNSFQLCRLCPDTVADNYIWYTVILTS